MPTCLSLPFFRHSHHRAFPYAAFSAWNTFYPHGSIPSFKCWHITFLLRSSLTTQFKVEKPSSTPHAPFLLYFSSHHLSPSNMPSLACVLFIVYLPMENVNATKAGVSTTSFLRSRIKHIIGTQQTFVKNMKSDEVKAIIHSFCFTDKETEAQSSWGICPNQYITELGCKAQE